MENKTPTLSELMQNDDIFFQAEIRIGPFKLLNQIGKGKFGTVSLGINEENKEKVAIKQIKKSELNTDNLLLKEINIQKILFHPYLTKLYCVIENEEKIFIISEYCSKGDVLNNLVENGIFDEEKSCKIFQQVLSSLEYLHKNNICHRDIKPENILLDEYGDAKLSDFGLSKKYEKNELLKTACGSPIYAAPEMLLGGPYQGTKIDIWSLGISLYIMVCGEFPFDVDDENDVKTLVYKITHGKYSIPENLSPECKDLIQKILEINPDKRITIDEIKKHKWVNMFNLNYLKSSGVFIEENFLPIDIYLIKDIIGENEIQIRKMINDILMNKHNINTINYYLKNEGKKRKGEKSVSDLRATSDLFIEYINDEKSNKKYWNNDIKKIEEFYTQQILELFNSEKKKKLEIQKEIKDSFKNDNNNNENTHGKGEKKHQMLKYKTELKLSINNEEIQEEIKIKEKEKAKEKVKENDKNNDNNNKKVNEKLIENKKTNNLQIVQLYIGPLIFIHDLIDNIITNVIKIENEKMEKNKPAKLLVSSSIKMEIMKSKSKPNDNNIIKEIDLFKEKSERKLSHQDQFVINKTHAIELVSTPKRIVTSFSFVNKVQSETVEINSNKKNGRVKRSGSCKIRNKNNKNNKINKNVKTSGVIMNRGNIIQNKNNRINKVNNKPRSKIIKSIDLTKEGLSSLPKKINIFKRRIKSISNINHIQINIIKNEIIFFYNNYIKNNNIKNKKEIELIKNYSQNYYFDFHKSRNSESKLIKSKLATKNSSKLKNRNRIPVAKLNNRSIDTRSKNSTKREPINMKKNKNFINIKKEILIPTRKDNSSINIFLKTPNKKEKMSVNTSSNMNSFYSPNNKNQNIVKNIFIDNTLSTPAKRNFIPLKPKKTKSIIFINNVKKDFTELRLTSKYYNNYIKSKKYQEKNNAHNSQLISLFSHPNENENESDKKNKKVNISIYRYSRSPSKEHMKHNNPNVKSLFYRKTNNNNDSKFVNTEKSKTNSKNKKILKNNNNKSDLDKEDDKLMKTKLTLNKIKQIIKRYVGNNVLEIKDNGIFKFVCKAKLVKDELIFHIELISKSYDTLKLKGNLVKGETKIYKDLLNKIKEKLS